ncbi:glutamate--cysteine ligase [Sessilibacter sp. MAH2]
MATFDKLLNDLKKPENSPLLYGILRGLEKESLRVTEAGELAQTPHPKKLGSALTHPQITTDFSESLLEFITPPSHQVGAVIENLMATHQFTYGHLNGEHLWPASMPCLLEDDEDIPVALYGNSNVGRMKTIYRLGLGHRYGRKMQTIAGIHYNFSLPSPFWAHLHGLEQSKLDLQEFRTNRYFDLIRNFRRYFWLLLYLFGASPAVCGCFVEDKNHCLEKFDDEGKTYYRPYATSLRMGDLGYQSDAQTSLLVDYNDLRSYLRTLCRAINTPYEGYQNIGTRDETGEYLQLNTSLLQIENEFYSSIRPKRTARTDETALTALFYRGVEYLEVRCLDLNPYEPLGISRDQMLFLDTFLLYCLLTPSPQTFEQEFRAIQENQKRTVYNGRDPAIKLIDNGDEKPLRKWGQELLTAMEPVAELLDLSCGNQGYMSALKAQSAVIEDPELTPSARVLRNMRENNQTFFEHTMELAQQHSQYFKRVGIDDSANERLQAMAESSLLEQATIEVKDDLGFDEYLSDYYAQYDFCARA